MRSYFAEADGRTSAALTYCLWLWPINQGHMRHQCIILYCVLHCSIMFVSLNKSDHSGKYFFMTTWL